MRRNRFLSFICRSDSLWRSGNLNSTVHEGTATRMHSRAVQLNADLASHELDHARGARPLPSPMLQTKLVPYPQSEGGPCPGLSINIDLGDRTPIKDKAARSRIDRLEAHSAASIVSTIGRTPSRSSVPVDSHTAAIQGSSQRDADNGAIRGE
jgi:hypothetical protein